MPWTAPATAEDYLPKMSAVPKLKKHGLKYYKEINYFPSGILSFPICQRVGWEDLEEVCDFFLQQESASPATVADPVVWTLPNQPCGSALGPLSLLFQIIPMEAGSLYRM